MFSINALVYINETLS